MLAEEVFAKRIKELRIDKRLSQQELADKVDLTQRKVSKLETLQLIPSPQVIVNIAKCFEVSADYLLGLVDY